MFTHTCYNLSVVFPLHFSYENYLGVYFYYVCTYVFYPEFSVPISKHLSAYLPAEMYIVCGQLPHKIRYVCILFCIAQLFQYLIYGC
jgi:hypothetical protein